MNLYNYILRMADNSLILGHRLSEWCGHGPVLEQDIAMTNMALDLIGQARSLFALAAEVQNEGRTEDDLAYLRDVMDFQNLLLVEQPNGDFAHTVVRQFFFSAFQLPFYQNLDTILTNPKSKIQNPKLDILRGIAEKAIKELTYHVRWSSEWVIRLGDGTDESHKRMQLAINSLYEYTVEAFMSDDVDKQAITEGYGVVLENIKPVFEETLKTVLTEATLTWPQNVYMQKGGKSGYHTEHLGYLLAEMQYLQRVYPHSVW
ncbi:MAG: phenylacetate-CoA oxygenase subunit PaaC [Saprospiraceae bacterium]|nr:phenylacetate-CoA oxygenase subunit PaaC [Saprospiraceae bacterium]